MRTLFSTVGGSHQPILAAIGRHAPDRVVFVCSSDDPVTRRRGSWETVRGDGSVIAAQPGGKKDLPNIPTQAGLAEGTFEVLEVPADDLAGIVEALLPALRDAAGRGDVLADYTGGTKSMAVGLALAGLQVEGVRLALVTGPRTDLVKVLDGAEHARLVDDRGLRARWLLGEVGRAWSRFAYSEAVLLLEGFVEPAVEIERARLLSKGLAAWDRFDHATAHGLLAPMGKTLPEPLMAALGQLRRPVEDANRRSDALRVWDLWRMADRRAASGAYDLSVLLLYRTFEAMAQWCLRWHHDIDTSDVRPDRPEAIADLVLQTEGGPGVLGLDRAWSAIGRLDGPLAEVGRRTEKSRRTFAQWRNGSLFAHGRRPIGGETHAEAREWLRDAAVEQFLQVEFKGREPFPQLPASLPE